MYIWFKKPIKIRTKLNNGGKEREGSWSLTFLVSVVRIFRDGIDNFLN